MKKTFITTLLLFSAVVVGEPRSSCYGTTKEGRLGNGVKLPLDGKNFIAYSKMAAMLGRTYVHSTTANIVIDAYKALETVAPDKVYKYAETGLAEGGRFKPHKTHQNGLSVDFMVPVTDMAGNSVHLPTHALNKFGYDIEFSEQGRFKDYQIDFEALAAHIVELHKAAQQRKVDLWRVIFDPAMQPSLFETKYGHYLKKNVQFSTRRSWVRHDEHYHVDFAIECAPIAQELQ